MTEPAVAQAVEFDCVGCGRHIVRFAAPPGADTCAECTFSPGWFRDPELVALLDPDYRGPEAEAAARAALRNTGPGPGRDA